jgi:hypothetical protein
LTPAFSPAVERLAGYLGGVNEYFQAADRARIALQSADLVRVSLQQPSMSESERLAFLDDWVRKFVAGDGQCNPGESPVAHSQDREAPEEQLIENVLRNINTRRGEAGAERAEGIPGQGGQDGGA